MTKPDVVIVGGGIAGASLAIVLARAGVEVLVLEQQKGYKDRVRGESMLPWGVKDAQATGIYDVLMDAGAHHSAAVVNYGEGVDPAAAEATAIPLTLVPGVPGSLNMQHRLACEALSAAAEAAGAKVIRGVRPVVEGRQVTFDGTTAEPRLVIGADGRASTVRRQIGIELAHQPPPHFFTGLLVSDLDIPDRDFLATEGELIAATFVQKDGWARVYVGMGNEQKQRFAGPDGPAKVLDAAASFECLPFRDSFKKATAQGPVAAYPSDDTWTDKPFTDDVLLIGDAAGHNNPLIGQGLSLAMRDVRLVSELLLANDDWTTDLFASFGAERNERMRRVRFVANYVALLAADFTPRGRARRAGFRDVLRSGDMSLLPPIFTVYTGPQEAGSEMFDQAVIDRMEALGA